jgi:tetratricopeptide (TPR) repeat protein
VLLRHPLFVDAIRRPMTPVELAATHRRLASAMASSMESGHRQHAAEVAEHWRGGDVPEEEWAWRVRAARDAQAQFAFREAASQWLRALDLWPATITATPDGVRRLDAFRAATEALTLFDIDAAARVATEALEAFPDLAGHDAAALYCTVAEPIGRSGDPEAGLALVDRAIVIYDAEEPSAGLVHALIMRLLMSWGLNRADEGEAACARGLEISAKLDDVALHREMLALQAEHDARAGRLDLAHERLQRADLLRTLGPDPNIDVLSALFRTDMLLMSEADADAVVEAGDPGLDAAADWGLEETHWVAILRSNVAQALRRAGRVDEAFSVVERLTEQPPTLDQALAHADRAVLDLLLGRHAEATKRIADVKAYYYVDLDARIWVDVQAAIIDLWCGRSERAFAELVGCVERAAADPSVTTLAEALAVAARAAADLEPERRRLSPGGYADTLDALLRSCAADPFAPHPVIAARPAWAATWRAERLRVEQRPDVDSWLTAAAAWVALAHPFDAAYCRWRAAQAAVTEGRRTVAGGMLRRAAREARGHRPLEAAIAATTAGR